MGSTYIFIVSANDCFGRGLNSLGGDEVYADLNVNTFHHASDIGLNEWIVSQAGINAVVCALTDVIRNW